MKVGLRDAGNEMDCGWRSLEEPSLVKAWEEAAWRNSGIIIHGGVQESCRCGTVGHRLVSMVGMG